MTKIKCVIIDDESVAQRIIAGYLGDLGDFEIIARCDNAIQANTILTENNVDLIFLDIEMPKINGLAFLSALKNPPAVIITTAHREYALEGFELQVVDYLLKPISLERFLRAINKYKSGYSQEQLQEDEFIYVKSNKKTYKLKCKEIHYIESMSNYVVIHGSEKRYMVYKSLSEITDELSDDFLRIHKSYVVNKEKITYFTKEAVHVNGTDLPIGRTYKEIHKLL